MHGSIPLIQIGAVLFGLAMLGRVAQRFGFSPIPLYLIGGLAFGQGGLVELDASEDFLAISSEIGVILLLVMLGLEYSADELLTSLRRAAPAGLLDGLLNAVPGAALGLLLGWGPVAAFALAGVTWVSSSGVIAKILNDLGRLGNRETPAILSVLVIEDLAMAFYLPVLTALLAGGGLGTSAFTVTVAVVTVIAVLFVATRYHRAVSALVDVDHREALLLGVFGLTVLVAGLAQALQISAAVGAFLVGIAISGQVAHHATQLLEPLRDLFAAVFFVVFGLNTDPNSIPPVLLWAVVLAVVTTATKVVTGWWAARRSGIGRMGRARAGAALVARGEFSIVIAGFAVSAGAVEGELAALAATYVLIMAILGPIAARVVEPVTRLLGGRSSTPSVPARTP